MNRDNLHAGTRTEEILKAMLLVLDEINAKLTQLKPTDTLDIAYKTPSINSKQNKK